jgi:hypothetical protein
MSSKSKSNVNDLLAAIKRTAPTDQPASEASQPSVADDAAERGPNRKTAAKAVEITAAKSRVGKPVQFWLHDEDRRLVRELAAWLAGQGIRPTDSMVIRAALRQAKTGGELLKAYHEASQLDGRLKQHKTRETA